MLRIHKQICKQSVGKILFTLMLIFGFSIIGLAQTSAAVSEQSMKQVVYELLIRYFKPKDKPKTIYLSDRQGLKKSWLPKIKNVNFQLLTDEEFKQKNSGVYFFSAPEFSDDEYTIGFLYGDYECSARGEQ